MRGQKAAETVRPADRRAGHLPDTGDAAPARGVKSLMFADVEGFSALSDPQVPLFMNEFVRRVAGAWGRLPGERPLLVQTWGDGIFCVFQTPAAALGHALAIQRVIAETAWDALGLPATLAARISLHAGPVFEGTDALTGRHTYFGSHVMRAARVEPVTAPGHIYATLPFVATLTSDRAKCPATDRAYRCDYVGHIALAKNYGVEPLYEIRPAAGLDRPGGTCVRPHSSRAKAASSGVAGEVRQVPPPYA